LSTASIASRKLEADRVAADVEPLADLTFLESIQLDGLHYFLPEVVTVGFGYGRRVKWGVLPTLRPNRDEYGYNFADPEHLTFSVLVGIDNQNCQN